MSSEPRRSILIVDDDEVFCSMTKEYLEGTNRTVLTSLNGSEALKAFKQQRIDIVLLDQKLPDAQGHQLCSEFLKHNDQSKIIFITAHPSYENAVTALRAGAYDYLHKPFEPEELALAVNKADRTLSLENLEHLAHYRSRQEQMRSVLVGSSSGLSEVSQLISLVAAAEAPVLITGETGTGKNMAAKAIHFASSRRNKPFVVVNCAALPEGMIEAELLGHERGAFTGAAGLRRGVFEMAAGGTLFLDEIGEMPRHLQAKLLGVLEQGELRRLGGESTVPVDVHVIAATAADLELERHRGFRQDLYFRLSVMRIHMPPLRSRPNDIPALCKHFLERVDSTKSLRIAETDFVKLQAYEWPGNVRELKNVLERAAIVQHGPLLVPSRLLGETSANNTSLKSHDDFQLSSPDMRPLEVIEHEHIRHVLEAVGFNKSRAARVLGISLSTLKRKAKRFKLD